MKIRVIEMMNHYYREESIGEGGASALGRFCALGYHDAIDVDLKEENIENVEDIKEEVFGEDGTKAWAWNASGHVVMSALNGEYAIKNVVCAYCNEETEKEKAFWVKDIRFPFFFFSVIRISEQTKNVHEVMKEENEKKDCMTYYCYEHNEIMAVFKTNSYSKGMERVKELYEIFTPLKIHSIFAVEEYVLSDGNQLKKIIDENVDVRWHVVMKDREKAKEFFDRLKKDVVHKGAFEIYDTLGSEDLLVEMNGCKLTDLLPLYATGNWLTHVNQEYSSAFYNIETTILVGRKSEEAQDEQ